MTDSLPVFVQRLLKQLSSYGIRGNALLINGWLKNNNKKELHIFFITEEAYHCWPTAAVLINIFINYLENHIISG